MTKAPPQLGQTPSNTFSEHDAQKVHSNEQMRASRESGGSDRSQHSQDGRSCSMNPPAKSLFNQFNGSRADLGTLNNEFTHGNWQLKSPGSATARVDIQNTIPFFDQRFVRMPRNNDLHTRGMRLDVELRKIVDDIDERAADSNHLGLRQMRCPRLGVIITFDGNERRHGGKLIENLRGPDVAAVNDVIAAHRECPRFGSHESVSV